jgi:hypothetical protein
VWILTGSVALIAITLLMLWLSAFFFWSPETAPLKNNQLLSRDNIVIETTSQNFGVQKGDAFPYCIKVTYNSFSITEIDRDNLKKSINLRPFEIRSTKEANFNLDKQMKVYQIEYELQVIDPIVDRVYQFPTILLQYKPNGYTQYARISAVPAPIYVAARLPNDTSDLEIRLPKGTVQDPSSKYATLVLFSLGGLLGIMGITKLFWQRIPGKKRSLEQGTKISNDRAISQGYRSLCENISRDVEPRRLLHQIDHILRLLLVQKENIGWLQEINIESISPTIRESVASLFQECQEAFGSDSTTKKEAEVAQIHLREILIFYFGEEVETWIK